MIAFDAPLIHGLHICAISDDVVVVDVAGGTRNCRGSVGRKYRSLLKHGERLKGSRIEQILRNLVASEGRASYGTVRIHHLCDWVVDGDHISLGIDPLAEVAVIHFRRGHCRRNVRGAIAIAETFQREKEERLVSAVVDFGDPNRTAEGETKVVL